MLCVDYIFSELEKIGIDCIFANPGTTELSFLKQLKESQIETVLCLSEGVIAGASDGYFRASNKPVVNILHMGVGLGNSLAYLHNAKKARSHILNIIGDNSSFYSEYESPLQFHIEPVLKSINDNYFIVKNEEDILKIPEFLNAFVNGKGIYSLVIPMDLQQKSIVYKPIEKIAELKINKIETAENVENKIESFIQHLRSGKPIGLIFTGDALNKEMLKKAKQLEQVQNLELFCPTFPAVLPRGESYAALKKLPYFSSEIKQTFGRFHKVYSLGGLVSYPSFVKDDEICIIDYYKSIQNIFDNNDEISLLIERISSESDIKSANRPVLSLPSISESSGFNLMNICSFIAGLIKENATVIDESNTSGGYYFYYSSAVKNHSIFSLTGGAIGHGIPMAIGASIACNDSKVICLQSDGSALFNVEGLWTQANKQLDITTILFVNHKYNIIDIEYKRCFGNSDKNPKLEKLTRIDEPRINWIDIGKGFGLNTFYINNTKDLLNLLPQAVAQKGPNLVVLDIVV